MINNIQACLPQWGISHAGVIYEAPVEGGISRMMAIFEDYDNLERIGSVRSCRNYFIFYAAGFEAIYVHYGQSAYAVPYLELPEVNNISGLAGYGAVSYTHLDVYKRQLLNAPYSGNYQDSQVYVLDGFIVSDNLEVSRVENIDTDFQYTDHQPVLLKVKLK